MLVLTRKPSESILLGEGEEQIEVTVEQVRGEQVRLSIRAPHSVSIQRKEVYERIQAGVPKPPPKPKPAPLPPFVPDRW